MNDYLNTDVLLFFDKHMDVLPLYEYLETEIKRRAPDTKVKGSKSQITFANKHGYAFVSFNPCRKAALRPATWMTVSFGLAYRKESSRIDVATEPYPNRWTHHVMVGSKDEIDDELLSWIEEAAAFSMSKR